MSPLWSDMALARAALATLEEADQVTPLTRPAPRMAAGATAAGERIRRLLRPRLTSVAL